jgi:hypothetical protein
MFGTTFEKVVSKVVSKVVYIPNPLKSDKTGTGI